MATEAKKTAPARATKAAPKVAVKAAKDEVKASPKVGKAPNKESAYGKVKVTQMIGSIGRRADQQATLVGLGLNKRHKSRVLEDTPSVRGMIYKVRHLLKVESAN